MLSKSMLDSFNGFNVRNGLWCPYDKIMFNGGLDIGKIGSHQHFNTATSKSMEDGC